MFCQLMPRRSNLPARGYNAGIKNNLDQDRQELRSIARQDIRLTLRVSRNYKSMDQAVRKKHEIDDETHCELPEDGVYKRLQPPKGKQSKHSDHIPEGIKRQYKCPFEPSMAEKRLSGCLIPY